MIAILHADREWGIGKKNDLMFSLPKDMKFFRETTTGKVVCMGYNTLLSFPNSKPLKNRTNIVLCEDGISVDGCICVHSIDELLTEAKKYPKDDFFIIGGASVYKQLLPYCKNAYNTKIEDSKPAEVFFPNLDENKDWELTKTGDPLYEDNTVFYFCKYENKNVQKYNWAIKPDLI